jgi:hypothetical protein
MSDAEDKPKQDQPQAAPPANEKDRVSRRQAIQTVVAGSSVVAGSFALPKQWTKPIVETIVSPAQVHALSPPMSMSVMSSLTSMMSSLSMSSII